MTDPSSTTSIGFKLPGSLIQRIDAYCAKRGFPSRSAGVRTLIDAGLSLEPGPHQDPRITEMYAAKLQGAQAA
jgi:metal-responsive CopG/Arc/MetJ family transcriptional regulator